MHLGLVGKCIFRVQGSVVYSGGGDSWFYKHKQIERKYFNPNFTLEQISYLFYCPCVYIGQGTDSTSEQQQRDAKIVDCLKIHGKPFEKKLMMLFGADRAGFELKLQGMSLELWSYEG